MENTAGLKKKKKRRGGGGGGAGRRGGIEGIPIDLCDVKHRNLDLLSALNK